MSPWERFPPASGTTLDGRFVVERELGRGSMGVVVSAQHLGLQRPVAVKLLRPELVASAEFMERFLDEGNAIARLKSEHVVDVLDVGTLPTGVPYVVMEHLSGVDLGKLVQKRGPLEIDEVVEYALQTLEALAETHPCGIVHRDLKPTNLFLTTREDGSGLIKVLDFGISKLVGLEVTADGVVTPQGQVLGPPHYLSPEHIQDASAVDARSDFWSLGAVMHELLTGRPPFVAPQIPQVVLAITTRPYLPPDRDDLPVTLARILRRCMRKSRGSRFQTAAQLAAAFQPLVRTASAQMSIDRILRGLTVPLRPDVVDDDDEPVGLPSIMPVESDTSPSRRIGTPLLLASAGLAVAIAGAFFLGRHGEERRTPALLAVAARPARAPAPKPPAVLTAEHKPVANVEAPKAKRSSEPAITPSVAPTSSTAASPRRSLEVVALPPPPLRRVRPLDTENPFRK